MAINAPPIHGPPADGRLFSDKLGGDPYKIYFRGLPLGFASPERVRELQEKGDIHLTPEQFAFYTREKIAPHPAAPAVMGARIPQMEKRGASELRIPRVEEMPSTPIYNQDRGF